MNANGKATHTVTSHWYRSSRACGVGSGEWVAHYAPCARVVPESESVCPSVWVLCVPICTRSSCQVCKVSSIHPIQCCVAMQAHTRGIGGVQVISLHPYKHTTATLLVHSHWVMSLMKQHSVWSEKATHPTGIEWVADDCGTYATVLRRKWVSQTDSSGCFVFFFLRR